ncbi:MAG: IclR family transcriptional regulator [Actinomycetes bacterium]
MDEPAGPPAPGRATPTGTVQSVERALSILDILARVGQAGVTELSEELGVHKSTAFRLLASLAGRQLVEQVGERSKYRLGVGILRLAGATIARLDIVTQAHDVCQQLARELGETVNLAVRDADAVTNLTQEYGAAAVTTHNWIGQRTPLHATSSGKVLLAWADESDREAACAAPLPAFTPRTITDPRLLLAELAAVREQGWAATAAELEPGLHAVAAPVRDDHGRVVAAVSVSGPSYRLSVASFPTVATRLCAGAREISVRMGYRAPG